MSPSANDEFVFLPLGGSGEIGMNLNLYGYGPPDDRRWLIVDCGVTFGDVSTPGVDVIMPDAGYIEEHVDNLEAILLTHAHEDHMGAVAHLWPRLRAPIYATPFTAWLVRDRLAEHGLEDQAPVHEIGLNSRLDIGPFDIQLVTITHSIPEPNAVAVRTPLGVVLHTGDWKIDPDPLIGEATDDAALRALGEEGVLAMVCDSTNVFTPGEAGSEAGVKDELTKAIAGRRGKVAVAAFASNVARLDSVVRAAHAADRTVCLAGRSMRRMVSAARSVGILTDVEFVEEEEAGFLPDDKELYLVTGSQGEPRAALARSADGSHRHLTFGKGDTVLFSSRVIPGNEKAIFALQNQLADMGVEIITEKDRPIHVSGHPCRDELRQMYQWARPRLAIPVHGERRHLLEHAKLARELQTPKVIPPHNGDMIRLAPGDPEIIDAVPAGRWHLDGPVLTSADGPGLRERKRMAFNGAISVGIALNGKGRLADGPDVRANGFPDGFDAPIEELLDAFADAAEEAIDRLNGKALGDDDAVEAAIVKAVKRIAQNEFRRRPLVEVMVLRV